MYARYVNVRHPLLVGMLCVAMLLGLSTPSSADDLEPGGGEQAAQPSSPSDIASGLRYRIERGDTLSEIADRFDVAMPLLLAANEGLRADRIRAGQSIRIPTAGRRVEHEVQPGESLSRLASEYEVRVAQILQWNPRQRRRGLRTGQVLTLFTEVPESRSRSIGSPNRGHLEQARRLPSRHPAYRLRRAARAWATDETVREIVSAFDGMHAADPAAPRLEIHDLSLREGGPMRGHRSHRSGRDVDIAYYRNHCGRDCGFRRIGPEQLDVARQWALFERWIESDSVDVIFMDHRLQRALYEEARRQGTSRATLSRVFQYPRAPEQRYGMIRHHPRHADHFHIRFRCHQSDEECR